MPAPDFDAIAEGIRANLEQGVGELRRTYAHEPDRSVAYQLLPYATVWLGPIQRPRVEVPQTQLGSFDTTSYWTVRVYRRLKSGEQAQEDYRSSAVGLIDAWDQYRRLNAPPGNTVLCDDSALTDLSLELGGDREKPVIIIQGTVQVFSVE